MTIPYQQSGGENANDSSDSGLQIKIENVTSLRSQQTTEDSFQQQTKESAEDNGLQIKIERITSVGRTQISEAKGTDSRVQVKIERGTSIDQSQAVTTVGSEPRNPDPVQDTSSDPTPAQNPSQSTIESGGGTNLMQVKVERAASIAAQATPLQPPIVVSLPNPGMVTNKMFFCSTLFSL